MIFNFGKKKAKDAEKANKDQADSTSESIEPIDTTQTTQAIQATQTNDTAAWKIDDASHDNNTDNNSDNTSVDKADNKASNTASNKGSYLSRLKSGLAKTGASFSGLFLGKKTLDDDLIDDLETALLMADVGIEATQEIIDDVTKTISRKETNNPEAVINQLKQTMRRILSGCEIPLPINDHQPTVILMVGINGAGKTTTIAKLIQRFQQQGKTVMLAAGDTFRAAAVEQLKTWGERANVPVISQGTGADAASVIFDAYTSAKAKNIDILIADTAGRLHTQSHLMAEIEKVVRVLKKHDSNLPHETMLVIDAGNGQNALNQAKSFHQSLGLTGITVTKLDGTAKGGMIFSLAKQMQLPIRFIGVGEAADDLREFVIDDFIDALLDNFAP
ncbi:signal recognition particle-docking protein FtsY [Ostreibacterium oceani]|uniref:Signal recognition particle receptor FtsY n=1 Tax=Ostreibacterium oceani TaxID=2654998 RepID=A0A6N7F3W1_9GAMM|nr:signal recognition particle-docking protein FtsY [Ostreibacterium oceani]MPV86566.1 signal recognition particle-docking protein FtsY [Ostreibacterium oceani]